MKTSPATQKTSLEFFPSLDGVIIDQRCGFYVEIKSKQVKPSAQCPQGIKLSITLRDDVGKPLFRYSTRLAYPWDPAPKDPLSLFVSEYDGDGGMTHFGKLKSFQSVDEMLVEFFAEVDSILKRGEQ